MSISKCVNFNFGDHFLKKIKTGFQTDILRAVSSTRKTHVTIKSRRILIADNIEPEIVEIELRTQPLNCSIVTLVNCPILKLSSCPFPLALRGFKSWLYANDLPLLLTYQK